MAGAFARRALWQYSHSASILFACMLFLAGFLCSLLWTNGIVNTDSFSADSTTRTLAQFSPAVSTFNITYQVAIFGTAWNAIIFVTLLVLERDALPMSSERLRYEVEKSACIVAVAGNALYSLACFGLMSVLARLAADPPVPFLPANASQAQKDLVADVASSVNDRRAGQGVTAAMAGVAAACAAWACFMDVLHAQKSRHRRIVKNDPLLKEGPEPEKQA